MVHKLKLTLRVKEVLERNVLSHGLKVSGDGEGLIFSGKLFHEATAMERSVTFIIHVTSRHSFNEIHVHVYITAWKLCTFKDTMWWFFYAVLESLQLMMDIIMWWHC